MAVLTSTQELTRQAISKLRAGETKPAAASPAATTQEDTNVTTPEAPAAPEAAKDELKLTKLVQVMLEGTPLHRPVAEAAHNAKLSPAAWVTQLIARELKVEMPEPAKKAPKTASEKAAADDGPLTRAIVLRDNFVDMAKLPGMAGMKKAADRESAKVKKMVEELAKEVGQEKANAILAACEKKVREIRHPESK